jgi:FkbM family methyltransferase
MSMASAMKTVFLERRVPYRVDRAINRLLSVAGFSERTIQVNGLKFRVRRLSVDEDIVSNVVGLREYLPHGIAVAPGDTVIDIGGNIGTFAVLAASLGAKVIVAEPDPENLALLRENISLNGLDAAVLPVAISRERGQATLSCSEGGGAYHSIMRSAASERTYRVDTISLADLFDQCEVERCDLLKIDCEGAEYAIFESFPDFRRIRQLAMEYHSLAGGGCEDMPGLMEGVIQKFSHLKVVQHESFAPAFPCGHLFMA